MNMFSRYQTPIEQSNNINMYMGLLRKQLTIEKYVYRNNQYVKLFFFHKRFWPVFLHIFRNSK